MRMSSVGEGQGKAGRRRRVWRAMAGAGQFREMWKMSDGASGANCNVYWVFKHLIDCNGSQWIQNGYFTDLQKKNGESN